MTLSFESTHEYYMKDPTMFYCAEHNGLCISEDYEDTVRFTGVTEKAIIKFVSGLFKHNAELAASLKKEIGLQDVKATSTTSKQRKTEGSVEAA
ncbi:hypothetical protein PROG_00033 [Prochlorococcus phage P-SSP10]|uniref:Uncharacterized protein n=1 Tax=Prochlorococcus phage P-SSP10 TaxID=885867 RepID=M1UAR6_9CAUD|nr:hypothetical protein PROG_00033 [Prochlorococcus phage P-SSP10]AGG54686.1 hypothetical protein PROG_00033 [Prochlorococcus phage P-SSP10]